MLGKGMFAAMGFQLVAIYNLTTRWHKILHTGPLSLPFTNKLLTQFAVRWAWCRGERKNFALRRLWFPEYLSH